MWRWIRFCHLARGSVGAHIPISCKYFCVCRASFWLFCCLFIGCWSKEQFRYYCGWCTHAVINIFSCIDVNLEVSFINPTLPLAEMNKKIFAEIDRCNSCVVERMLKMCECSIHENWLLECVVFLMLIICYLTHLKLASGNAYNCNDRSGMSLKENMYFFNVI